MKKFYLTFSFLFILGFISNAQQLSYGIKIGTNLSTTSIDNGSIKAGFNGGIAGQFRWINFAIQPEILFSQQGTKYTFEPTVGDMILIDYTGKININYLSVPLMFQYYIFPDLNIEAGPQISILLSAKNKPDDWESNNIKDNMKKTDLSLNFGASYQLPLLPLKIYARYSLGLTDIFDTYDIFDGNNCRNRTIQFGIFVRF